jgi:hypothetical protein
MRRSVWSDVGGFSEHLRSAEDLLFMNKIDEGGFKIAYAPAAVVSWNLPPSLWLTFKRFYTYSRHNLNAGLARQWQVAILLRYVLLLALGVLFFVLTPWWLVAFIALSLSMYIVRSIVVLWRNRVRFSASIGRNVLRMLVLVPLLITLDVATIAGTIDWLFEDKLSYFRARK